MKSIRQSLQISRPQQSEDGARPGTSRHFKMPSLLQRSSMANLNGGMNGSTKEVSVAPKDPNGTAKESQAEERNASFASNDSFDKTQEPKKFVLSNGVVQPKEEVVKSSQPNGNGTAKTDWKNTPSKKAMQDFLQKTQANIKAKGAKLEIRIPKRRSKVVEPSSKPSSKRNSQVHIRTFDLDSKTLDRMTAQPQEKKASAGFLEKQRKRADSRKPCTGMISLVSAPHQAERDRRPLSANEVEAMFLGAPYFNVQESKAKYKPQVVFKGGDARVSMKFPPDYESFGHASYKSSTLCRQNSRNREDSNGRPSSIHDAEVVKPGSDLREVPNMLSAQGLDPGAVGLEHFLQMPMSDTTLFQQEKSVLDKRKQLALDPEWLGLRDFDMEHVVRRLNGLGELYAGIKEEQWESPDPWNSVMIEEMGEELFEKLLSADLGTTGAGTGSVTLKTQITALQKVLNTEALWYDFSLVEWRIRVGQLLWATPETDFSQLDDIQPPSERDVLLLQITLAAELLIRLHVLEALSSSFPLAVSQQDADVLESQRTSKMQWDLLLAERFLDNIKISSKMATESEKKANRASFFSVITFFTAKETEDDLEESMQPILTPKNETEQLTGLVHFAESIGWPHASDVKIELESKLFKGTKERPVSTAASIYATPLSSPKFPSTPGTRNSFFGFNEKKRPGFSRTATTQSVQLSPARNIAGNIESFEVGGWLSRSWLSGLVMPGEAASHFLISALLENSPQAITALGEEANLYGGFVYEGRSYWSTTCAVGRVLAASSGVKECMGWMSVPENKIDEDGWIDVAVKEMPNANSSQRIKQGERMTQDSSPLYKNNVATVQAGDFVRPTDGPVVMGNEARCEGLSFIKSVSASTSETTITANKSFAPTACLTFSSPINSRLDKKVVPLTYDVHFISSYPCHPRVTKPRSGSRPMSRPMTPSAPAGMDKKGSSPSTPKSSPYVTPRGKTPTDSKHPAKAGSTSTLNFSIFEKELPSTPAHPLHIDFQYEIIPVANLLSTPPESRPRALSSPKERKMSTATLSNSNEDIVILDCRGTEDLELLARAWCAKVGENALIGKSGRTCLACCVREARALGVCVVIRT